LQIYIIECIVVFWYFS